MVGLVIYVGDFFGCEVYEYFVEFVLRLVVVYGNVDELCLCVLLFEWVWLEVVGMMIVVIYDVGLVCGWLEWLCGEFLDVDVVVFGYLYLLLYECDGSF